MIFEKAVTSLLLISTYKHKHRAQRFCCKEEPQ